LSAGAAVPTIHRLGPYRFFFYSDENRETREPPHVHVRSSDGIATFWLSPVSLRDAQAYTPREIERIRRIVIGSREMMLRRWHEFFDHLA
jgi:uncharacterized protein YcbX